MKKVLVTGVAGFIGNRTAKTLLEQGTEVIGIDNMNDYYDVSVKEHRLESIQDRDGFRFFRDDIEDYEKLDSIFRETKPDAVINLAARAGVRYSLENPFIYMTTNANATLNLLELMRRHGVSKIVQASTSSLYAGQPMPFVETLPVNTPISPYAASKKAAEAMAYAYNYLFELDVTVLRYFTVYGPAGRPDMSIFRFIKWIDEGIPIELFGDGSQSRDFTYIDDIARGTVMALKPLGYEIINLGGGGEPLSLNYMIDMISRLLGKPCKRDLKEFHKADIKTTSADISKARELLGWTPSVGFDEGIKRSVDWYLENREWVAKVKL